MLTFRKTTNQVLIVVLNKSYVYSDNHFERMLFLEMTFNTHFHEVAMYGSIAL